MCIGGVSYDKTKIILFWWHIFAHNRQDCISIGVSNSDKIKQFLCFSFGMDKIIWGDVLSGNNHPDKSCTASAAIFSGFSKQMPADDWERSFKSAHNPLE